MTRAELEELGAEFACSCSVDVSPEWSISLWQCPAGEDCPAWRLITGGLEQCVRQLGIQAIVPVTGAGQGAGGSL